MKKTWIKIKRGLIIDPQHRHKMGECRWLYDYMLDRTNWDTGFIEEWRDPDEAAAMEMPVDTLRKQRKKLDRLGYITCHKGQHGQRIEIHKWTNPRKYDGEILNENDPPQVGVLLEDQSDHGRLATDGDSEKEDSDSPSESPPESPSAYSADGDPSLYSQVTNHKSHDQTPWTQTLTAILQTYYKRKKRGDFTKYWQPTIFLGHENGVVTILCELGEEQQDWLQDRQKIAERMLVGVLGKTTKVVFVTGDEDVDNS